MDTAAISVVAIAIMAFSLFAIPLGLPGTWIMIAVLAGTAFLGVVGPMTLVTLAIIATGAEVVEFLLVKRFSSRYGGSRLAFWGAVVGGLAGVVVGIPIPVVGSVVAGVVGSFAGAAAVTLWETRRFGVATRVGWGVVLARVFAVAVKTAAGIAILVAGATALLVP